MRWQDTAEQILKELGVVLEEEQAAIFYDDADYKVALALADKAYEHRELVIVESC